MGWRARCSACSRTWPRRRRAVRGSASRRRPRGGGGPRLWPQRPAGRGTARDPAAGLWLLFPSDAALSEPGFVDLDDITADTWTDVDYSSVVPTGITMVHVKGGFSFSSACQIYARPNSSQSDINSATRVGSIEAVGAAAFAFDIGLDSAGIFEVRCTDDPTSFGLVLGGWYDDV